MKKRTITTVLCAILSIILLMPGIAQAETPESPVTREQVASMLVEAFGVPPALAEVNYFIDDDGTQSEPDINALADSGITKGCTDTQFCPEAHITRGEVAILLQRSIGIYPASVPDYFWDDTNSPTEKSINVLAHYGITKGSSPGFYNPDANLTYEQLNTLVYRAKVLGENPEPNPLVEPKTLPADNREAGRLILETEWGMSGDQWYCLEAMWTRESNWSNTAQNPSSSAYGIPQFLDSTWAGTGYAKTSDVATQIRAGLVYITNRYGTPCAAWSFWQRNHWY